MKVGIVGGPNSGKTTIFNALTRSKAATAGFSSGQVEIHTAVVDVPDSRLDHLSELFAPRPAVYAQVTFSDVAGLTEGIGKEGSIQGPLLNAIAVNDALLLVARSFSSPAVPHPRDRVDPRADFDVIETEFLLNDMVTIENRLERIAAQRSRAQPEERQRMAREEVLLERLYPVLESGTPLRKAAVSAEEARTLAGFGFLSLLPLLRVVNAGDDDDDSQYEDLLNSETFFLRGRLEADIAVMPPSEADEFLAEFGIVEAGLNRAIRRCYTLLGLISFLHRRRQRGTSLGRERRFQGSCCCRRSPYRHGARLHSGRNCPLRRPGVSRQHGRSPQAGPAAPRGQGLRSTGR